MARMKSSIVSLIRLDQPKPQEGDWICTAHGRAGCTRDIVAVAELQTRDAVQPYRVCEAWLVENEDAADYLAERGYDNR
ncbi:hypothetical protein MUK60_07055 [Streptomyces sp. LRE541]|uniref:hypothetical protein n=1 Tax=Streptomyces sp. LRE541 TaxID=2931983 RepID=UPI0020103812|nr:hypothetical protein [Streptomyces sp. LRE541]UPZ27589.1 hypothetical protein MUK60_07055 [Streptomyces sp. LRE541]